MASLLFSLGKELLGNIAFDSIGSAVEKKDFGKTLLDTITNPASYVPGGRILQTIQGEQTKFERQSKKNFVESASKFQNISKGLGMRNLVKG